VSATLADDLQRAKGFQALDRPCQRLVLDLVEVALKQQRFAYDPVAPPVGPIHEAIRRLSPWVTHQALCTRWTHARACTCGLEDLLNEIHSQDARPAVVAE
jgi:hypothetical protein